MWCLNEQVDMWFAFGVLVILAADIVAIIFIFKYYPSESKQRRHWLTIAILIVVFAIIASVLWTLTYFFSVYPKSDVYIGIGTDDDDWHPKYLVLTKRYFVFYLVLIYVIQGSIWYYFYGQME